MRNLKKFLALVLAMLMVVSAGAAVSAFDDVAADNQYAAAIDKLAGYGIVNGTGEGVFSPDDGVERFQMAIMMARALKPNETNWNDGMAIFEDVDEWYGAIAYAYINNIVNGVCEDPMLFAPHDPITYAQALTMAVRALGYTVENGNPWWLPAYTKATELGLTNNMASSIKADDALTRAECAQIIANMLAAKPADGGATIEAKNFGVATIDNTTTFVVTATPKQQFDSSAKPTVDGTVGIQKLINGIPAGEVIYVEAASLGITDVEASFAKTVNFVNYNEETNSGEKVILGDAPVAAPAVSISDANSGKIKIGKDTYYIVPELTGSTIKNEIVVFKGTSTAVSRTELPVDSDGNIVDGTGKVIAPAVKVGNTTMYSYKGELRTADYMKKQEGIAVTVENNVTYGTYTAKELQALNNNYRINLYDDDGNGIYDRASIESVYIAVYNTKDGKKLNFETATPDLGKSTEDVTIVNNTGTDLAKGDVFAYTYNKAIKTITVLEVLPVQTAKLEKVNTVNVNNNDNNNNYRNVTVTLGGTDYVLANSARVEKGLVGAIVKTTDGALLNKASEKIAIDFVDWKTLVTGATYNFVLYNNTVIAADIVNNPDVYTNVVMKEITTFSGSNVYMNVYENGVVKEIAVSAVKKLDGTNVTFSKLNVFSFSTTVAKLNDEDLKAGTVCRMRKADDGSVTLEALSSVDKAYAQTLAKEDNTLVKFTDGIADKTYVKGTNDVKADISDKAIRTNKSTVFYFINEKGAVTVFVGSPTNNTWIDRGVATIYANKLGYGSDDNKNGVAGTVVVAYTGDIAEATNIINPAATTNVVYVLGGDKAELTYTMATASTFGLSGNDIYRAYNVNAINLTTGAKVTTLYVKNEKDAIVPVGRGIYNVDVKNNVVKSKAEADADYFTLADVKASDFKEARTWTIKDSIKNITKVALNKISEYDLKSKPSDVLGKDDNGVEKLYTVIYVLSNNSKTFTCVAIENTTDKPVDPKPEEGIANAYFTWNSETKQGAIYDSTADTVTLYKETVTIGGKVVNKEAGTVDDGNEFTATASITKRVGGNYSDEADTTVKVNATYKDGVLTIKGFKDDVGFDYDPFESAGTYKVVVTFPLAGHDCVVTYFPVVG